MDSFTQVLGTAFGMETYRVGKKGLPEAFHGWQNVEQEQITLILNKNITGQQVDEAGKLLGTMSLKAGEIVSYYRTNSATWADVKLSDGRICRVEVSVQDDAFVIDGIPVEKVFDGIIENSYSS